MRLFPYALSILLVGCFSPVPSLHGGEPTAAVSTVEEIWYAAYINGNKNGHSRFIVEQLENAENPIYRVTQELRLVLQRDGQRAEIKGDMGTLETKAGKVVGVFMKQWTGKEQVLTLNGTVKNNKLHVVVEGPAPNERMLNWNDQVIGLWGERKLLQAKRVKTGDTFTYRQFYPSINAVLGTSVKVGEVVSTKLPGQNKSASLMRVQLKPDPIQMIQLPGSVYFVDPETYDPVMIETELPGLGTLAMVRSNKTQALAVGTAKAPDTTGQSIRLKMPIPQIHLATAVTYRIHLQQAESDPKKLLAEDARQTIDEVKDGAFSLRVEAIRMPLQVTPQKVGDEYIQSNHFINSEDATVVRYAKQACIGEVNPWTKARRMERWVRENMKPVDYSESMATSDHVAKTLSGDCTEFSMLLAAMCRAQGIPSRTAIGLVYHEDRRLGPVLAFHMWTEVFVEGQWLGLDATLGQGSIGAGHIKITDHHWNEIRGFDPLLPVMGFLLAKPTVEVQAVRRPRN